MQEPDAALLQQQQASLPVSPHPTSPRGGGAAANEGTEGQDAEAAALQRHLSRLPGGDGARTGVPGGRQHGGADEWARQEEAVSDATGLVPAQRRL